jgi:L-galactose dehydrogenase/L-glyceraldehyde 3-phosphate reductase
MIASGLFTSMNAALNILNPSAALEVPADFAEPDYERVIHRATAAGIGVMAIRVLGGGELATMAPEDPRALRLSALARDIESSLEELAVRFVLSTPGVQTAVLGLSEVDHVRAAAVATEQGPLDRDLVDEIARISLAPTTS